MENFSVSIDCASLKNITSVGDSIAIDEAIVNVVPSIKKASKEQRKKWNATAYQKLLLIKTSADKEASADPIADQKAIVDKKAKRKLSLKKWNDKKKRKRHEEGVVPGRRRVFPKSKTSESSISLEETIAGVSESLVLESVTHAHDVDKPKREIIDIRSPLSSPAGNAKKPIDLQSDTPPQPNNKKMIRLPITGGIERYYTKSAEPSPDSMTALLNVSPIFLVEIQKLLSSLDDPTRDDFNERKFGINLIISSKDDDTLLHSSISCKDIKWLLSDGEYLTDSTLESYRCLLMREEMNRANTFARDWKPCFITSTLFMTVLSDRVSGSRKFGYSFENAARHQDREIIGKVENVINSHKLNLSLITFLLNFPLLNRWQYLCT